MSRGAPVSIFASSVYSKIKSFNQAELLVHLQEQAATDLWPRVSRELDAVAKDAVPAITAALADETERLLPKLSEQLTLEATTLQANLNKRIKTSLDGALAAELKAQDAALRAALPEFSSDDALYDDLVRRLQTSASQWAMGKLDTTFAAHVNMLQSINESVLALTEQVAKEKAAGKRGDAEMDEALSLFIEILNSRLNAEG